MATAGKITVDLETKTSGWTAGLEKTHKATGQWADDIKGKFKGLTFDGGENFNAGGVAKFADTLKKVVGEVEEVTTSLRTGTGYGEAFSEAINKVPIVGAFKQAGEGIAELIFGTKAAKIEAEKWLESTTKISQAYRAMSLERGTFGKYGDEKALADADIKQNAEAAKLTNERMETLKKLKEVRKHDAYVGWYTDAQKSEMERLKKDLQLNDAQEKMSLEKAENEKIKIKRSAAQNQHLFLKGVDDDTDQIEAKMQEKSLKRQGEMLKSAIVAVQEMKRQAIKNKMESVSDFNLEGMGMDPAEAAERRKAVTKSVASIEKDANATIADLRYQEQRKQREEEIANNQKLREIQASANIDRLKMQDEQVNARNEKTGVATRSHLAEVAQIEEDFRKQGAALARTNREQNNGNLTLDDNFRDQLAAIREERANKLKSLDSRSGMETTKIQEAAIKEQRRLWEEAGTPAQKYAGHLADINDHFLKYHDLSLKNAELKKLDNAAFAELKRLNPDHDAPISLYGRTGSYADVKVGGAGTAIAQQQLEEMKKQATLAEQAAPWLRAMGQWFMGLGAAAPAEFTI